ncbi:MAG: UDP-N-acetylmuramoyl-tripeptide--D-alanyl-D-alanine ligase [Candidatus Promineifilaceae bacterium]|jgi:UDP-N-acetylmuramoyl-tripeptide--D-alanyl-D-alanine ligase
MGKMLSEKLAEWCSGEWDGDRPMSIIGATMDSRTLKPGELFFALPGVNVDGHDFVGKAFEAGASAAVVRAGYTRPAGLSGSILRVAEPSLALREAAREYRKQIDATVVGITGSAGKTTVKEMVASVVSQCFRTAQTLGNWNNDIGLPLSLLSLSENTQTAVIEMGTNNAGEIADLCTIALPTMGVVTNIGAAHIENFGSLEAIASEKGALLAALPASGLAVLDCDDGMYNRLRERCTSKVITISEHKGDYVLEARNVESRVARIRETATNDVFEFTSRLPGLFVVKDAMFAIAIARGLGMNWVDISDGLKTYQPQPMRWEFSRIRGVNIVNDAYNANPVSMRSTIDAFAELDCTGRKWIVLGGMLELGKHERALHLDLGHQLAVHDWHRVVVVGPLGWTIAEGAADAGLPEERLCRCQNNSSASELLLDDVQVGDSVLVKGSRGLKLEEIQKAFTH